MAARSVAVLKVLLENSHDELLKVFMSLDKSGQRVVREVSRQ